MDDKPDQEKLRIDKWLWAARFFKTRALAATAVETGKVQVNGARVKPAKTLAAGDTLAIRLGPYLHEVEVLALSNRRGPAPEAQKLYRETEESKALRLQRAAERKAMQPFEVPSGPRPSKRDRREMNRVRGRA